MNRKGHRGEHRSAKPAWKHSHNYIHHTFTNIRGKGKDLGYEIMRIDPHQKWHPVYLAQPFYNVLLMALFEWDVALHDIDLEAVRAGEKSWAGGLGGPPGHRGQGPGPDRRQGLDRVAVDQCGRVRSGPARRPWPTRSTENLPHRRAAADPASDRRTVHSRRRARRTIPGVERTFWTTLLADATANVIRNVWAHGIIFCGHFPDQTYTSARRRSRTRHGAAVRAPTRRCREHRGQPAVPHHQRKSRIPGRAPPLSGHAK